MRLLSERQRFVPHGMLAINPQAFGQLFCVDSPVEPKLTDSGVAIVDIRGPLMNHHEWFFDSYESIKARVSAAVELSPRMIILAIDSPGGLVSGALDTARDLRSMAAAAQIDLRAHICGSGASAAYALASAASWIGVSETAMVGSVGVIDTIVDATEQNAMLGLNVQLVASGLRKSDGNPNVIITDGAMKSAQQRVDGLAEMFFELIASNGWGGSVDELRALQAGIFNGREAVAVKLASDVATLEQTIELGLTSLTLSANTNSDGASSKANPKGDNDMPEPMEDAIAALRKAAQGDDEEEAKRARAALKSLGVSAEEDEDTEAQDDEDTEAQDDEDTEAQDDEDDEDAKSKSKAQDDEDTEAQDDEDEGAKASAKTIALKALAEVHTLRAEKTREKKAKTRADLIASRNDLSTEMVALLEDTSTPIKTVRKMVKSLPAGKPVRRVASAAASATVVGTRGLNAGDNHHTPRLAPEARAKLDEAMGLSETTTAVKHEGNRVIFGAVVPKVEGK